MGHGVIGEYGIVAMIAAFAVCAPAISKEPAGVPVADIVDIPLPGRANRFDHQSYDRTRHLLFLAHLGDGTVAAVDTRLQRVTANITGIRQVHGLLVVPELGRVYASATGDQRIVAIDESSFEIVAEMPAGEYPDSMVYVPSLMKLYVADKHGAVVVIDVASNRTTTTIPLEGEAGNVEYDSASGRVFVNLRSIGELAEIDPTTDTVVALHRLPGARENQGLLIVPEARLAFIACEGDARMLVLDLQTMEVLSSFSVGAAPDLIAFDRELGLLYVASESGVLSIFQVKGKTVAKAGETFVAPRAHSVAVTPDTHRIYLPLENVDGRPVVRAMAPSALILHDQAQ